MSASVALYKYLNRRLKKHRAQKLGIPYEDDIERNLRLLREDKLSDGRCLAAATPEEIDFAKRDGLGGGIDWKNWRKYFTQEHWTLRKLSKSAIRCLQASRSNEFPSHPLHDNDCDRPFDPCPSLSRLHCNLAGSYWHEMEKVSIRIPSMLSNSWALTHN